jgi:magnesium-transporting ATPase (P-type)
MDKVPKLKKDDLQRESKKSIVVRSPKRGGSKFMTISGTRKKSILGGKMKDFMFGIFNSKKLKVIDFNVLPDLGDVSHVTFDKTDTLTKSVIEIKMISTTFRCYNIQTKEIVTTLAEIHKNPEKYRKREDFTDKMTSEQIERYSEKSQEYEDELDGNFLPEVFDEDQDMVEGFRKAGIKMDLEQSMDQSLTTNQDKNYLMPFKAASKQYLPGMDLSMELTS